MDDLFQPFVEFYWRHHCPNCNAINWTSHSHSQRSEPIHSPEVCQCHACGRRYWLTNKETVEDLYPKGDYDLNEGESVMFSSGAIEERGRRVP